KMLPAASPASTAASMERFTAAARVSASKSAVRSMNAPTVAYVWGPSSGMSSTSSGARRASVIARSSVRFNEASSSTFVVADARRYTAVADAAQLRRFAFTVGKRTAHPVGGLAADHVHRIPKYWCVALVCHIAQHPRDLSLPDLIISLAGELKIETLMVDRR